MKISKILLTSLLVSSVSVSCKDSTSVENKKTNDSINNNLVKDTSQKPISGGNYKTKDSINKNLVKDTIQEDLSDGICKNCGKG